MIPNIMFMNIAEIFIYLLDGGKLGSHLREWPGCSVLEAEEKKFDEKIINLLKIRKETGHESEESLSRR